MKITTAVQALKHIWERNFFDGEFRNLSEIKKEISKLHCNPSDQNLCNALKSARYLKRRGKPRKYIYIQKYPADEISLSQDIFPDTLIKAMGVNFENELSDLRLNYGKSGTCTAFLLRKMLEKMIYLAFAKHNLSDQLNDSNGYFLGLKDFINKAKQNNVHGKPFLLQKTAKAIEGIKFLGDTSAHNFLTHVEMKTIIPQMPFIITAYQELSKSL